MRTKVYLFTTDNLATEYGVGTYVRQLTDCLVGSEIELTVVELFTECSEVTVVYKNGYRKIIVPTILGSGDDALWHYSRSVAYLLKEFIPAKEEPYTIFHLNLMSEPYVAKYLRELFNCKIILTVHYTTWSFLLSGRFDLLVKILSKEEREQDLFEKELIKNISEDGEMITLCDKIVCIANHSYQSLCQLYPKNKNKLYLVPNALKDSYKELTEGEKSSIRKRFTIKKETKVVLFAGRLTGVKGIYHLLEAFRIVINENQDAHLFIAGDGELAALLAKSRQYSTRVSFMGKLSKEELYDLYDIADIGIVPSLHEEFGLVALEMMMHRIPLIVSDSSGLAEIMNNEQVAIKTPVIRSEKGMELDEPLLAQQILQLLADKDHSRRLGINGRQRFLDQYEITRFRQDMIRLYQETVTSVMAEN